MKININELLEQATKRYESGDFHAWISDLCIDAGEADIEVIVIAAIEHSKQADKDTTAILEAAKELGRIEVLDAAISLSLLAYPNGQVTWIDPVSIQLKRGSRSEFLDAHREVVL